MNSNSDIMHVALSPGSLDDVFNQYAGTVIISILEHTQRKIIFHIINLESKTVDLEKEKINKEKYQEISRKYSTTILFHKIVPPKFIEDKKYKYIHKYTYNTISRLHLPQIFPDIPKIIYLDCDIIVLTDLGKLWDIDISKSAIAGVKARNALKICRAKIRKKLKILPEYYINAGVLIMNNYKINELYPNLIEEAHKILMGYPKLSFLDQDIIVLLFNKYISFIDKKYNKSSNSIYINQKNINKLKENIINDSIIHYIGNFKPWNWNDGILDDLFWIYYSKTPWCNSTKTLIDSLLKINVTPSKYFNLKRNIFIFQSIINRLFLLYIKLKK